MRNKDVIEKFMSGVSANNYSKNLVSHGSTLFNYNTKIAQHYGGITLINGSKYSSTTSTHQNQLKSYGLNVVLNKDDFKYVTELDWADAYSIVHDLYEKFGENLDSLDFTLPQKKYDKLREELQKYLYINKK